MRSRSFRQEVGARGAAGLRLAQAAVLMSIFGASYACGEMGDDELAGLNAGEDGAMDRAEGDEDDVTWVSSALRKGQPGAKNGMTDYCRDPANKCVAGEGNCVNNSNCEAGLVCAATEGARWGLPPQNSVCVPTQCDNNVQDPNEGGVDCGGPCGSCTRPTSVKIGSHLYCSTQFPCVAGEGSCAGSVRPCTSGLMCAANAGLMWGYPSSIDVCQATTCTNLTTDGDELGVDCGGSCPPCSRPSNLGTNGQSNYCTTQWKCGVGEGRCDSDAECQSGLTCTPNAGAFYGLKPTLSVCDANVPVKRVTTGGYGACGVKGDGTLVCWGTTPSGTPSGTFKTTAIGGNHACGIASNDTLVCWGNNGAGQGVGIAGTFIDVGSGQGHNCAIRTDGTVSCWGSNFGGETNAPSGTFTRLETGSQVNCGIRTDGTITCWGYAGNGSENPPAGTFRDVDVGLFTCGVKQDRTIACWGPAPTPPKGNQFVQVVAGQQHGCALKLDGSVTCWGANNFGQTDVPAGTFKQIDAGGYYTCGLKTDNTVACWGANFQGQLNAPGGAL